MDAMLVVGIGARRARKSLLVFGQRDRASEKSRSLVVTSLQSFPELSKQGFTYTYPKHLRTSRRTREGIPHAWWETPCRYGADAKQV